MQELLLANLIAISDAGGMLDPSLPSEQPIAWIATHVYGAGSEVWMRRQAKGLNQFGVHVLTHKIADSFIDDDAVSIHVAKGRWPVPQKMPMRWGYKRFLGMLNPVLPGAQMSPAETRWWVDKIRSLRPSICVAQFGPLAIELLQLMRSEGVPLIAHFHGRDVTAALNERGYVQRLKESLPLFDACIVVAEYQRQTLLGLGASENDVHVIPCGVPTAPEVDRNDHPDDRCKFLSVGRLVEKKRPDATLEAFSRMANVDSSTLTIIGDGPMQGECERLISQYGVGNRVRMLGSCSSDQVVSEMQKADVFVQHSVIGPDGDCEGWPVAIAEAASLGLPIVATRHASIPTQVIDHQTGLLVDEHDVAGMSDAMNALALDGKRRKRMGTLGRQHIAATSLETQLDRLQCLMQDCIAKSTSDPNPA